MMAAAHTEPASTAPGVAGASAEPLLKADGITHFYGSYQVLDRVDLSLYDGELVSVVGPNGAGKTTLIHALTGFIRPTQGSVLFLGNDIAKRDPVSLATSGLARSFQLVNVFPELNVRSALAVGATSYLRMANRWASSVGNCPEVDEIVERIADAVGLRSLLDQQCSLLPHGKRKLLDVACALTLHPKVLLLDEPTAGVSTADKYTVMETLLAAAQRMRIRAIMLIEHDMDLVRRYSSRIVAMQAGRKIADLPKEEFFSASDVLAVVIGCDASGITATKEPVQ